MREPGAHFHLLIKYTANRARMNFDARISLAQRRGTQVSQTRRARAHQHDAVTKSIRTHLPRLMGQVAELKVPLVVEVGIGPNWEAAH